jgi:hypothetical protein
MEGVLWFEFIVALPAFSKGEAVRGLEGTNSVLSSTVMVPRTLSSELLEVKGAVIERDIFLRTSITVAILMETRPRKP